MPLGGLRASLGYDFFPQKNIPPDSLYSLGYHGKNLGFIPIRAGYQYFILPDRLFVAGEAGICFLHTSSDFPYASTRFSYSFGLGYPLSQSGNGFFDISAFYNVNPAKRG